MLHVETVERSTLDILKKLLSIDALSDFNLVGGTALSLKYGHRKSIDIDLFSSTDFLNQDIYEHVSKVFPDFSCGSLRNPIGVFGFIGDLKIDLVKYYKFPIIRPIENIEGIRFYSDEDICAMKIFAILKRGVKKDFYDISLLLDKHGLENIINSYNEKYPNNQMMISIPTALVYFDDAEESEDPKSLSGDTWKKIKKNINKHVNLFLK